MIWGNILRELDEARVLVRQQPTNGQATVGHPILAKLAALASAAEREAVPRRTVVLELDDQGRPIIPAELKAAVDAPEDTRPLQRFANEPKKDLTPKAVMLPRDTPRVEHGDHGEITTEAGMVKEKANPALDGLLATAGGDK